MNTFTFRSEFAVIAPLDPRRWPRRIPSQAHAPNQNPEQIARDAIDADWIVKNHTYISAR